MRNPKAVLRWDSSYSLSYRVFLYEENTASRLTPLTCLEENCNIITNSLKQSDGVDKRALLVVTIQVPKFTEKLFYKVTGDLIFQQGDRNITLVFPEVEISAYDATGHDLVSTRSPQSKIKKNKQWFKNFRDLFLTITGVGGSSFHGKF